MAFFASIVVHSCTCKIKQPLELSRGRAVGVNQTKLFVRAGTLIQDLI